jgi:hypothetical protein
MTVRLPRPGWVAVLSVSGAVVILLAAAFASGGGKETQRPPGQAAPAVVPSAVDLSRGQWQVRIGPAAAEHGWIATRVPGVFDSRLDRFAFHGTVGWYRLRFVPPRLPRGFSWALRFDQVRRSADVWLNGRHLGRRADASLPFTLAARGVRPGQENLLMVRADNRRHGGNHEAWWNWGGITRAVWLVPRGTVRLDSSALLPQLSRSRGHWRARVILTGRLRNRTPRPLTASIEISLTSPDGTVSRHVTRPHLLRPGASSFVHVLTRVRGRPRLWMPGHPALYGAAVRVTADGATVQVDRSRVGLRSLQVRDGLLFLNGRRLSARGASIAEDLPGQGAALDGAGAERLVADLQSLHADITRMQYLPNEQLLDKLDEAGILLWSQAAVHVAAAQLETARGRAAALRTVRATVLGTRGHPAVLVHSVANELAARPDARPGIRIFMRRAAALTRRLDPTAPAAVDIRAAPGIRRQLSYDNFPVLGLTTYFGWYRGMLGHPQGPVAELDPYLEAWRRDYPAQAALITEFGAEAVHPGPAWLRGTYEFQSRYLAETLHSLDREPWLAGAIYFTARDFPIKPYWGGGAHLPHSRRDVFLNKGLLTYDGTPKPAAAVARHAFAASPTFAGG